MVTLQGVKRVAVLRNQFLPYSETFIHDELRYHERYRPTVLARRLANSERFTGHDVVAISSPRTPAAFASFWYGISARSSAFDEALRRDEYALIHAHFLHNGAYAMDFAARHRLPLVVSAHGHDVTVLLGLERFEPKWWFFLLRYRKLFRTATLFLAASQELADLLVSLGCAPQKIRVCRLGVELDGNGRESLSGSTPRTVVMVGRFVEKKGHLYGIEAVAQVRRSGVPLSLVIVGAGPLKERYEARITELGLRDCVKFTGPLNHQETLRTIASAQVLLAPSVIAKNLDRESGMIVAKEASALGVPVVGTVHGGLPEIVDDGITGYLVPERDSDALARQLGDLLRDEPKRRAFGDAAREKMHREYDIRNCVRHLEAYYDEAVALYAKSTRK